MKVASNDHADCVNSWDHCDLDKMEPVRKNRLFGLAVGVPEVSESTWAAGAAVRRACHDQRDRPLHRRPPVSLCVRSPDHDSKSWKARKPRHICFPSARSLQNVSLVSLTVFLILSLLVGPALATRVPASGTHGDRQRSALARHAQREPPEVLLVDRSQPPVGRMLQRRKDSTSSTSDIVPSSTKGAAASATSVSTDPQSTGANLPMPFDANLGSNFTSTTCPTFFNDLLSNSTFQNCHPLSLLLQVGHAACVCSISMC
jgi:hypothetical protein